MSAQLVGVGVGPGDPELLTLAAVTAIESADVVAYHARPGGSSTARSIAERFFRDGQIHELLHYPVTTGITDHPGGYAGAMAEFYVEAAARLSAHLDAGRTVAVLALGDPMLYSSYQHLHRTLEGRYPTRVIPGVPSVTAAADVLGQPLAEDEEVLTILPGTLPESELVEHLRRTDTAVIMKLGRTFTKVRRALQATGAVERAYVVSRVGMDNQDTVAVADADPEAIPYFSVVVVPSTSVGRRVAEEHEGEVVVVGLGPGADKWTTPEVVEELARATDIVGYSTYVNRVAERAGQRRHLSDNKVEAERAAMALDMPTRASSAVVSVRGSRCVCHGCSGAGSRR